MVQDIFRIPEGTPLTEELLRKYINKNKTITAARYAKLHRAYDNDYPIFHQAGKPVWKPDNRTAVNFARYITDTYLGFFAGIPVKVTGADDTVTQCLNDIDDANDSDDLNAEIAHITAIYGRAYRIAYVDGAGEIGSAYLDPTEAFALYDEGIKPRMLYFVRTYLDVNKVLRGSVSDDQNVHYFHFDGGLIWDEHFPHGFGSVPAVEFIMNTSRRGIFEDVLPLINTYNKALSEKANDVDYFSESYLKVLGAELDKKTIEFMRENRVINLKGGTATDVVVEFMSKPSGDATQEHLLDRLEAQIFRIAMVCNVSDDNFATSSGIALKYKLLPMVNLAARHWRKFAAGLNQYYKLVCANPVTPLKPDDWRGLKYVHTLNYPANISEEADTARKLAGITSRRTQLSVLSIVDDVDGELDEIEAEEAEEEAYKTQYNTNRTGGDDEGEDTDEAEEDPEAAGETV